MGGRFFIPFYNKILNVMYFNFVCGGNVYMLYNDGYCQ